MAPALSVRYMVTTLLEVNRTVMRTEVDVLEVAVDFLEDKITKTEVAPFKQPSPPTPALEPAPPTTTFAFSPPHPIAHRRS